VLRRELEARVGEVQDHLVVVDDRSEETGRQRGLGLQQLVEVVGGPLGISRCDDQMMEADTGVLVAPPTSMCPARRGTHASGRRAVWTALGRLATGDRIEGHREEGHVTRAPTTDPEMTPGSTPAPTPTCAVGDRRAGGLLVAGIAGGLLFLASSSLQGVVREGFAFSDHPPSALAGGGLGWVQAVTFLVSGLLLAAGGVGLRLALRGPGAGLGAASDRHLRRRARCRWPLPYGPGVRVPTGTAPVHPRHQLARARPRCGVRRRLRLPSCSRRRLLAPVPASRGDRTGLGIVDLRSVVPRPRGVAERR
jgi:hypothetical protein